MGDRAQERRLDDVGAAQRGGLDDLALQRLALQRGAQQRLQRGYDALLQARETGVGGVAGDDERAEPPCSLSQRERDATIVGIHRIELDHRRRQLERGREARGGGRQRGPEVVAAQQDARHLGREIGLAATLDRLPRARAGHFGDRAGEQRRDQEGAQGDPVVAVGDRELAGGRQVEEVERARARPPR